MFLCIIFLAWTCRRRLLHSDTEQCLLPILMIMRNGLPWVPEVYALPLPVVLSSRGKTSGTQGSNGCHVPAIGLNFRTDIDPAMAAKAISRNLLFTRAVNVRLIL